MKSLKKKIKLILKKLSKRKIDLNSFEDLDKIYCFITFNNPKTVKEYKKIYTKSYYKFFCFKSRKDKVIPKSFMRKGKQLKL